jgi:hypothetical protein
MHCHEDDQSIQADRDPGGDAHAAFPIEARRGDRRIRQPIKCDVVEDVIAREARRVFMPSNGTFV